MSRGFDLSDLSCWEGGGSRPGEECGSWECGFQTAAPALPPPAPLSRSGTRNERSSCPLVDLLAVRKKKKRNVPNGGNQMSPRAGQTVCDDREVGGI